MTTAIPREPHRAERLIGRWLMPAVATVVFMRYLPTLADWMSPNPEAEDYLAGPNFSWAIALLDLGIALPATVGVCCGYRLGALAAALYAPALRRRERTANASPRLATAREHGV